MELRYVGDERTARAARAELARAARSSALPPSLRDPQSGLLTWADLLFRGEEFRNTLEPSQRLLLALARLISSEHDVGLARHFNELPGRALGWYLEERLGIVRQPPVPDRVPLVAEGDAKRLPASLPQGTLVVAGTDARGAERRYATADPLTVLGTSVAALHSHRVLANGDVVVHRTGEDASEPGEPYHPFGAVGEPGVEVAPHELYIASRLLSARTGTLTATLTFEGVEDPNLGKAVLGSLQWEVPGASGYRAVVPEAVRIPSNQRAVEVVVGISGEIAARPAGGVTLPHLRARFPEPGTEMAQGFSRDAAFAFQFTGVKLRVHAEGIAPTAGLYNGGVLDLTKEFQPFGPVPRRGDGFYLQVDEAFSKPLQELWVTLEMLQRETPTAQPKFISVRYRIWAGVGLPFDAAAPAETASRLMWQAFRGGRWHDHFEESEFASLHGTGIPNVPSFSEAHTVGGIEGHFLRAFLFRGDFGWEDYLSEMAANATRIAKGQQAAVTAIRPPPDPPVVTRVAVDYTTHERTTSSPGGDVVLLSRNALGDALTLVTTDLKVAPFVEQPDGSRGVLYLGLSDVPPGEIATLFFDVEEASACNAIAAGESMSWECRTDQGEWRRLEVIDGTLGLRQSGIVRLATRADWGTGAPEVRETGARWIRTRTDAPQLAGRVARIAPDAVEAVYVLPPRHVMDDPTPETPIEAGAAKGPKSAVPGIKKLSNPVASHGGRGPEPEERYVERAAGVLRHRGRAVTPWDVEALVRARFPDVAMLRCLPHRSYDSDRAPGWFAIVVVPRSSVSRPQPSVRLAAEIERAIAARGTPRARVAVLCPAYVPVRVEAGLQLRPGFGAAPARDAIEAEVRSYLHPLGRRRRSGGFGQGLALSEITRLLEERPEVDFVREIRFGGVHSGTEHVEVAEQIGLIASAEAHELRVEAAL